MLEQILDHIHNYFTIGVHAGKFTIEDGSVTLDFMQDGQYYCVSGSVFNDGVHQYPSDDLTDETFEGIIRPMAVPKALIDLSSEIGAWVKNNPDSAFTSESFGGYSYSKGSGANGAPIGWKDVFRDRLNHWRKIS